MDRENEIRLYMNSLSKMELADSVYLFRLDFMECPLQTIFSSIVNLYVEVGNLKDIIQNRFEEDSSLTEYEAKKQLEIIQDYGKKNKVLEKILCNNIIYESVIGNIVDIETNKCKFK